MKNKLILVGLLLLIGSVYASPRVIPEQYSDARESWSFSDEIGLYISQGFNAMTVVNGAECSIYPDEVGYCSDATVKCPSSISNWFGLNQVRGCAVVTYNCDGSDPKQVILQPGQTMYPNGKSWENYFCINTECTCTNFADGGCGKGGCPAGTMLRERSCPSDCAEEQVCVYRSSCTSTTQGTTTTTKAGIIPPIDDDLGLYAGIALIGIAGVVMLKKH